MLQLSLILITGVLALAASGCGGSDDGDATKSKPSPSGSSNVQAVNISDFLFAPKRIVVEAGTKLVWSNRDDAQHTATADDGSFDTGPLRRDQRASAILESAGAIPYHCDLHPFMRGEIVVQ